MAQVDAGMRKNRHQDLGSLSRMGYSVLRAVLTRAMQERSYVTAYGTGLDGAGLHGLDPVVIEMDDADAGSATWSQEEAGSYLHAVAAARGVQLDEYSEVLIERPPMLMALLERQRL